MNPKGLSSSKQLAAGPYPDPRILFKINFNIIIVSSTPVFQVVSSR
jgi:hypothetical protein